MINLNTKSKHGETANLCTFKDGQFKVSPQSLTNTLGCLIVVGCQINVHEGKLGKIQNRSGS